MQFLLFLFCCVVVHVAGLLFHNFPRSEQTTQQSDRAGTQLASKRAPTTNQIPHDTEEQYLCSEYSNSPGDATSLCISIVRGPSFTKRAAKACQASNCGASSRCRHSYAVWQQQGCNHGIATHAGDSTRPKPNVVVPDSIARMGRRIPSKVISTRIGRMRHGSGHPVRSECGRNPGHHEEVRNRRAQVLG